MALAAGAKWRDNCEADGSTLNRPRSASMRVELFYSPGCDRCAAACRELRLIAERTVPGVEWHERNVLEESDRAVELGVFSVPAFAIDDELLFAGLPTVQQLRDALKWRGTGGK